jgi:hypothetical protein
VTPPALGPWMKVSVMDAGHFDALTAYAAINTLRLDDLRPHIFRTHDGGKTWTEIVNGIPAGAPVDAVREDPGKKGLLFAGTEREVFVSFDDGGNWQSLRLNMPAGSVRDLMVKDDDLIAATHGRGFWILDNITPLRQLSDALARGGSFLYQPQTAIRVRWNMNTDTPLPPDEPGMPNPPDGAMIDYYLAPDAHGPVTLEILDAAGALVRRYAGTDPEVWPDPQTLAVPMYWVRPPHSLPGTPGMHRFLWDMHYTPLAGAGGRGGGANYGMQAVAHDTPPAITSIWAAPGRYTVKLTVNGKVFTEALTIRMDPRVKTAPLGLEQQFTLSKALYDGANAVVRALAELRTLRTQLATARPVSRGPVADAVAEFDQKAVEIEGGGFGGGRGGGGGGRGAVTAGPETLSSATGSLTTLMRALQDSDVAPTTQLAAAVADRRAALARLMERWTALKGAELDALNAQLKGADQPLLRLP